MCVQTAENHFLPSRCLRYKWHPPFCQRNWTYQKTRLPLQDQLPKKMTGGGLYSSIVGQVRTLFCKRSNLFCFPFPLMMSALLSWFCFRLVISVLKRSLHSWALLFPWATRILLIRLYPLKNSELNARTAKTVPDSNTTTAGTGGSISATAPGDGIRKRSLPAMADRCTQTDNRGHSRRQLTCPAKQTGCSSSPASCRSCPD